ncbi:MAG: YlbF family regulator [Syntrophothermus sp.]
MSVLEMAQELAKALRETQEYRKWQEALARVEENAAAQIMFRDFRQKQSELQKAILAGETVGEEKAQELQRLYEIASYNPIVRDLFAAEQQLGELVARIQQVIVEAVGIGMENREGEGSK